MMKKPIDVPTQATVAFIASHLHSGAAILEVGCGEGHVALELLRRGYHVLGVDSDREIVARAQQRGVPAVQGSWPEFESPRVDAIAFTRSLHHIGPLEEAVGKARELLGATGVLLVEDFALDEADQATLDWFLDLLGSPVARALIAPVPGELVTELLGSKDAATVWQRRHDREVHTSAAMTRAIEEHFVIRETRSVPYFYRYLVRVLPETPQAAALVEEVLREESGLRERREGVLIGRRTVGHPRDRQAPSRT